MRLRDFPSDLGMFMSGCFCVILLRWLSLSQIFIFLFFFYCYVWGLSGCENHLTIFKFFIVKSDLSSTLLRAAKPLVHAYQIVSDHGSEQNTPV